MSKEAMKLALDALEMVDDEGENRAVRMFLALYGGQYGVTAEQMRKHLSMSGFDGAWPEWANTHNGHLTKAGAQLWIHHLFSLEQPAQQQELVSDLELVYLTIIAWDEGGGKRSRRELARRIVALYTSPPTSKPWVGLTDEEVGYIADEYATLQGALRAIEAKLKEKNT